MSDTNGSANRIARISKRDFLWMAGASFAYVAVAGLPPVARGQQMSHDAIIRMGLVDGVNALRAGKLSSVDYCTAALAQADKFKTHNIFTQISLAYVRSASATVDGKRKEGKAVGALQGVPYALKDTVDMVEYYTISGHPSLKTFEPLVDADLVKVYKEADAICIGKTQVPPLSMWWTTENPMTGDTGNPFNIAYKTGGSSGGSGAAVAARIVPFAVAEDTFGSVRVPSALNGVQGLRPTTGRWPTAGTMPLGFSDTLGPMARSVADIKFLDSLSAADHPENKPSQVDLKQVRIGYQRSWFFEELHPWVQENVEQTMSALSRAGAALVELKGLPGAEIIPIAVPLMVSEFPGNVAKYFNRHRVYNRSAAGLVHELHIDFFKKFWVPRLDNPITVEDKFDLVAKLLDARKAHQKVMGENRIDVLLYPSTKAPNTPNDGGEETVSKGPNGEALPDFLLGANTFFGPAMRTPSIAMFSGMDKAGLPLSVTIDGHTGQDRRLLDIAEAIEKVLPPLAEPKSA